MKLKDYEKETMNMKCKFCQGPLGGIEYYENDGGWQLDENTNKQWLFKTCLSCGHQWSLGHLGISKN